MKDISRQLLATAELRARAGHTALAAYLDTSEQLVQYHLQRLEQDKVILGYNAIIDHSRIGWAFHLLYLRFFDLTVAHERKWLKHVAAEVSGVALVARTVGRWSAIVGAVSRNNRELSDIITETCKLTTGKIAELSVTTELECSYTSLQLLTKRKPVVTATERSAEVISIDELDQQILILLARNCRLSATEIARRVDSSPATILRRVDALEENRVILGYRIHIDYERFGFQQYRLLLRLADLSPATIGQIKRFLLSSGSVESVSRYLGMADLDFRCYMPSLEALGDFVAALRDRFSTVITNVEIVPVFYWRRMNYFPAGIAKE